MLQKLHKAGRPIPDSEIYEFVQKSVKDSTDYLYERDLHPLFLEKFHIWINNSQNNNIKGLNEFDELTYVHGTSQSFDNFYFMSNTVFFFVEDSVVIECVNSYSAVRMQYFVIP